MILWIALALSVGTILGFMLCAILAVASNADDRMGVKDEDQ